MRLGHAGIRLARHPSHPISPTTGCENADGGVNAVVRAVVVGIAVDMVKSTPWTESFGYSAALRTPSRLTMSSTQA